MIPVSSIRQIPAPHQSLPLAEPNRKWAGKWTGWNRAGAPGAQSRAGQRMDSEGNRRLVAQPGKPFQVHSAHSPQQEDSEADPTGRTPLSFPSHRWEPRGFRRAG